MPNRILREGILTSERVSALSWAEEVFFRRLMSVVDDFGRYYATPMLLRAACYPLQLDKVSDPDIEKWLTKCVTAALVRVYPAQDGKRYLEVLDFKQQVRAKNSKFPPPTDACAADAKHMPSGRIADAHLDGDGDAVGDEGDSGRAGAPPNCPVSKIIDLYNQSANRLPKARVVADAIKSNISARWRDDPRFQDLEFWQWLFGYCEANDFLSGAAKDWRASLDWIVKPTNFMKIVNGNYDRAEATPA